jgi:hypothetical protein
MAGKLSRLTHKITLQLHLVAESHTICSSCSRQPVQKLLDTPSYVNLFIILYGIYVFSPSPFQIFGFSYSTFRRKIKTSVGIKQRLLFY